MKIDKRYLVLSLVLVFALSFVWSLNVVNASSVGDVASNVVDPVKSMFTDWTQGNISDNVAKYLFTILLFIMIWAILDGVNIFGEASKKFNWGIALIVSFLSVAYLVPSDLYLILISYSALGLTLGAIFPFLLLAFWYVQLHRSGNTAGRVFSKILWIAFMGFLIYKLFAGYGQLTTAGGWTYLAIIVLSVLWFWFGERMVVKAIFKEEFSAALGSEGKDMADSLLGEVERRERDKPRGLSGGALSAYNLKTEKLRKEAKSIMKKYAAE